MYTWCPFGETTNRSPGSHGVPPNRGGPLGGSSESAVQRPQDPMEFEGFAVVSSF